VGGHLFQTVDAHGTGDHVCALTTEATDSDVYCWGRGYTGQLGTGTTAQSDTAVAVLFQ